MREIEILHNAIRTIENFEHIILKKVDNLEIRKIAFKEMHERCYELYALIRQIEIIEKYRNNPDLGKSNNHYKGWGCD